MESQSNPNPTIYDVRDYSHFANDALELDNDISRDPVTAEEIFEFVRNVNDPEHPLTLEQLNVLSIPNIHVDDSQNSVLVLVTPTIPHCSMATLIGLCVRVKLLRSLPTRFKVTIQIFPGSHSAEESINKQLNDKERVAAALENGHLLDVVNKCIARTDKYSIHR